jgi:regulator of sigma E protease
MLIFETIITFIAVIAVLTLVHELGHFLTARAAGVAVPEFGIGFPPRLFAIKRGETTYSINLLPLGGYVKLAGEEDPTVKGSLAGKSIPVRLLVLASGSIMNFLLPIILFSVAFMVPHDQISGKVTVQQVTPGTPAANAGLLPGDVLLKLNGNDLNSSGDLNRYLQINLGKPVNLLVQHVDKTTSTIQVVPRWKPPAGQGPTGLLVDTPNYTIYKESLPFWKAIPMGFVTSFETLALFKNSIIGMFIGTSPVGATGPVGIAQITGEALQVGFSALLEFTAFLSLNLAIFNLFPLPALDGGRIAFVVVEWARRGKRVNPRTEAKIHLVGFIAFILFMLAVTYQDIIRIVAGQNLTP